MWRLIVVWSSMLKTKKGVQVDNMLKRSLVLVLLAVFCLAVNVSAAELVLKPLEDTYIRDGGDAANNFGNADVLQLKWESDRGGMTRTVFLKFDISEIENVERATLRLFMELNDVLEMKHIALYDITGVEWSENTLTWETAPKTGGEHIRDVFTDNFANVWLEINLTEFVKKHAAAGTKVVSIRIEHKSDHWGGAIFFTSKEGADATKHPQLVITY